MNWKQYEHTSTEDLLTYISWKDQEAYKEDAKAAYTSLFFRFKEDIGKKARIVAINWGYDKDVGDVIAEQAFERFWSRPYTFEAEKCKTSNLDKCVLFYIYRIAQRLLADYKKTTDKPSPYTGEEEVQVDYPDLENVDYPKEKLKDIRKAYEVLAGALARLTEKHKVVYLTYHAYEKKGLKLPRPLLQALRDELELTQNSIRVYKKEAKAEIATYLKLYGNK